MKGVKGFQKGNTFWLGKKHSQSTKNKLSKIRKGKPSKLKGRKLSDEFKRKLSEGRIGMVFSDEHKKNLSKSHIGKFTGENHPRWLGDKGKSPLVIRVRECFKYRQWRSDIFTRDNFTCVICGIRGGYLEVDHYPKMFSEIWREYDIKTYEQAMECEEFWNINNGRTVCKAHNPRVGRRKNGNL